MQKINFQNLPSTSTPINATNLNTIQSNVEDVFNGDEPMGNIVVDSIRSKNIFSSQLELGTYDSSGNKSSSNANYRNANFVAVQPNTTYTFSINGTSQKYVLLYYTSARAFISQDTSLNTGTFTTPNDCYFINIRCFSADFTSDYGSLKIQLEEGSTATSYSPYQFGENGDVAIIGTLYTSNDGREDYADYGFHYDGAGNMRHKRNNSGDSFGIDAYDGTRKVSIYADSGDIHTAGNVRIDGAISLKEMPSYNLNEVIVQGTYQYDNGSNTYSNSPVQEGIHFLTITGYGEWLIQEDYVLRYGAGFTEKYIRQHSPAGWSAWQKII